MIQISNSKISKFIFSALIVAGLFLPASKTHAQESFQFTFREIAGKISTLLTLKRNADLSHEEKNRQEISARKEAVQKIFDLTKLEQTDLLNRLSNLKNLNEQQEKMQDLLTEFVEENSNGLNEIQKRLDEADTLEDIKQLATDFKNWRTLVYNPKTEKVVAFTFVFQGKNILSVANERLERVKSDFADHQKSIGTNDDETGKLLNKAETDINEAEELNEQARNLIMIALSNSLLPTKNSRSFDKEIARDISDSKLFTEKSMRYVRSAYAEFLELGKRINNE